MIQAVAVGGVATVEDAFPGGAVQITVVPILASR